MIITSDGELRLTPIDGDFSSELQGIYELAGSDFGGFAGQGGVMERRGLLPGQGSRLNAAKPENLEHLAISVGTVTVGYVALYRDFPAKSFVELLMMYIAPAARGMGSGSRALEALSSYFYEAGYGTLRVRVGLDERDAMRFFYRSGFTTPLAIEPAEEGGLYDGDFIALTLEKTTRSTL